MRNTILAVALILGATVAHADIDCKSWNSASSARAASFSAYAWGYADAAGFYLAIAHREGNVTVFGDAPGQYSFKALTAYIDVQCLLKPKEMVSRHIDRLAERLVREAEEP